MDDGTVTIQLGRISSYAGELSFSLNVRANGLEEMQVYASDPKDRRKAGVFLRLSQSQIRELGDIVEKALTATGRLKPSPSVQRTVTPTHPAALVEYDDPRQLYQTARAKLSTGDQEATAAILREIVRRFPTSEWAAKASKALSDAGK